MCDENELEFILRGLIEISSIISLLSALVIILLYVVYEDIRSLSCKVIVCISVSDLIRSICLILPYRWYQIEDLCQILAIINNSSLTTNAVWSIYIMFLIKQFYSYYPNNFEVYFKTWFCIAFVLSPLFHLLPLSTYSYGLNEGICTYKNDENGIIWRVTQQSIDTFCLVISLLVYLRIFFKLKSLKMLTWHELIFEKGMIYSIFNIVAMCTIMVYRISELSLGICDNFVLAVISYLILSLNGFFNVIAMLVNKNFRSFFFMLLKCEKIKRGESVDIENLISLN